MTSSLATATTEQLTARLATVDHEIEAQELYLEVEGYWMDSAYYADQEQALAEMRAQSSRLVKEIESRS